mgnify:FL=1
MLNIRVVRSQQFIRADHEGTLDLEESRNALCSLLAERTESSGEASGAYDVLFDVRDAEIDFALKEVWALLEDVAECDPGFDGKLALLDDWDDTFDRMQFFEASSRHIGVTARAFLDFEVAVDWLWESRGLS